MEDCIRDIRQWMVENRLKMNNSKTEFLTIGSSQQLKKIEYDFLMVGDTSVKVVDNARNLGAYFDSTLSMVQHIDTKCTAAALQLYRIRKIRKFLTKEATEILIHAFIFSHLDYCNGLLYSLLTRKPNSQDTTHPKHSCPHCVSTSQILSCHPPFHRITLASGNISCYLTCYLKFCYSRSKPYIVKASHPISMKCSMYKTLNKIYQS